MAKWYHQFKNWCISKASRYSKKQRAKNGHYLLRSFLFQRELVVCEKRKVSFHPFLKIPGTWNSGWIWMNQILLENERTKYFSIFLTFIICIENFDKFDILYIMKCLKYCRISRTMPKKETRHTEQEQYSKYDFSWQGFHPPIYCHGIKDFSIWLKIDLLQLLREICFNSQNQWKILVISA